MVFGVLGSDILRNAVLFTKAYKKIVRGMEEGNVWRFVFISSCYDHDGAPCFFTCCIKPLSLYKVYIDIANFDSFLKKYKGPVQYTNFKKIERK